jgi:YegS/Rv2252/BmrU family lipid kinase
MSRIHRAGIVINPVSGARGRRSGEGPARADLARHVLDAIGVAGEVVVTTGPHQAGTIARDLVSRGAEVVIAWGGDGTINDAATPLIGTATPLGIVRSGSGDGLGRTLGVPEAPEEAIRLALSGASRAIDVGYLGGRHFLNVAGIGFDAAVGQRFNAVGRRGQAGYLLRVLETVWTYRARRYRIRLEHETSDATRFVVAFANGRQYGGQLMLAPDADPADGWLDAVIVDDGAPLTQIWRMRRLAVGVRKPAKGIFRYRVREAAIAGDRLVCHVDGEAFEASGELAVRLVPGALRVAGGTEGSGLKA